MRVRRFLFVVVPLLVGAALVLFLLRGKLRSDEARIAAWADREVACLLDPLESYRAAHGSYPERLLGPRRGSAHETYARWVTLPDGKRQTRMCDWKEQDSHCHVNPATQLGTRTLVSL